MARYDTGSALAGAGTGAAIGSGILPGVGTAIGAGIGGLIGLFSSKKKKPKKKSTMDKTQQALYQQYAQGLQGEGQFANLFNFDTEGARKMFKQSYADPAYQQFQEEVVPGITGQFRGGNLQNSSYLGGALAKEGANVQKNLDAQLAQMLYKGQQDSIDRRLNSLNNILGMQTFAYEKPQPNGMDALIGGFANGAGKYAAQKFGDWANPTPQAAAAAPQAAVA